MKMSALKSMMMAAAIMVATCVTVNAATPAQMNQDTTMKKGKMGKGKMGKKGKMKRDTTTKM
ncbi:MAG: hypothetical protein EOP42_10195 [Sphingobacteriaceae bacterium]|nr:MAG: hypothetical protein EOP42_10195 [Sphingobacteriaceae bacterium]